MRVGTKMQELFEGLNNIVFESLCKTGEGYFCIINLVTEESRWSRNAVDDFEIPGEYTVGTLALWMSFIHTKDKYAFYRELGRIRKGLSDYCVVEYRVRMRNGKYVKVLSRGSVLRNHEGQATWFSGITTIVEDLHERNTQLKTVFEASRELDEILASGKAQGALIYIGIDDFKRVNDLYTYAGGNEVLKHFAKALERLLPPNVKLYKLDGDKFGLIYPYVNKMGVMALYQRITETATGLMVNKNTEINIFVSGGAVFYPEDGETAAELMRDAEYALETAKNQGKRQITFFSSELLERYLEKLRMIEGLKYSVNHNFEGFYLCYQPIVDVEDGKIIECEALLRWKNKEFTTATPADFIPILEETGMIIEVGEWIVHQAMTQVLEWKSDDVIININVSYKQLKDDRFAEFVLKEIEELEFDPKRLVLELTESCKAHDMPELIKTMDKLRDQKVNIALDDFGTGYASLSVLREVPTDWVKIDHNFVARCRDNDVDRNIVKHIILLAHALGIRVCVEGIENTENLSVASEEHADTLQGYYFSRPVEAEQFEKMLMEQNNEI